MKLLNGLILFTVFFLFLSIHPVGAAVTYDKIGTCLEATQCLNAGSNCSGGKPEHRVKLTSPADPNEKAAPNNAAYLTECLYMYLTPEDVIQQKPTYMCTTGNPDLDIELWCGPIINETDKQLKLANPNCNTFKRINETPEFTDFYENPDVQQGIKNQQAANNQPVTGIGAISAYYTLEDHYDASKDIGPNGEINHIPDPYNSQRGDHASYGVWYKEGAGFVRQQPPVKINTDGQGNMIPQVVEWQSYTQWSHYRSYLLWTVTEVEADPRDTSGSGGQQQDILSYIGKKIRSKSCGPVTHDPYGRVFDAKSLEPIPGASMELRQLNPASTVPVLVDRFEKSYANEQNPGVANPYQTNWDGGFSFYVVDGSYMLFPTLGGYTHPARAVVSQLPANTSKIYSDLYFSDSSSIVQQGAVQHRDIPFMPDGEGKTYPLKLFYDQNNEEKGSIVYSGKISHPFATLTVKKCNNTTGTEVCDIQGTYIAAQGGPDAVGEFSITFSQDTLKNGDYFKAVFTKKTLASDTLSQLPLISPLLSWIKHTLGFSVVHAQSSGDTIERTIEPIPSYLEGYAYDGKGTILTNANVEIYTPYAPTAVYTTTTDETGRYVITSEHLPAMPYTIRYPAESSPIDLTPSQFLAQNDAFIQSEKIDPYQEVTSQTNPRRDVIPSFVPEQKVSPVVSQVSPTRSPVSSESLQESTVPAARNPVFLAGAILLLLLGGAGILLAVYVYRKRSSEGNG